MEGSIDVQPSSTSKRWTIFLNRCLQERIPPEKFENLVKLLSSKAPLSGSKISTILLKSQTATKAGGGVDPLVPQYVEQLVKSKQIKGYEILSALLECSRHRKATSQNVSQPDDEGASGYCSPELEEMLFNGLSRIYASWTGHQSLGDARKIVRVLSDWMSTLVSANTEAMMHDESDPIYQITSEVLVVRESVGILLLSLAEDPKDTKFLEFKPFKGIIPIHPPYSCCTLVCSVFAMMQTLACPVILMQRP